MQTVVDTLHFRIAHDDITVYNAVQKLLYIIVILAGISQVITGLAIWKPVQFSGLVSLLGGFQTARVLHFAGMAVIVGFLIVHVALAVLVPKTLWAMMAGGPRLKSRGHAKKEPGGMRSPFRPDVLPDAAVLDEHRPLIRSLERRGLIRGGLSLGALVMLTGCDVKRPEAVEVRLARDISLHRRRPGAGCSTRTSWRLPIRRR